MADSDRNETSTVPAEEKKQDNSSSFAYRFWNNMRQYCVEQGLPFSSILRQMKVSVGRVYNILRGGLDTDIRIASVVNACRFLGVYPSTLFGEEAASQEKKVPGRPLRAAFSELTDAELFANGLKYLSSVEYRSIESHLLSYFGLLPEEADIEHIIGASSFYDSGNRAYGERGRLISDEVNLCTKEERLEMAKRLRDQLYGQEMNVYRLADFGITRSKLYQFYNHGSNLSADELYRMCQIFGVSFDYVLFGDKALTAQPDDESRIRNARHTISSIAREKGIFEHSLKEGKIVVDSSAGSITRESPRYNKVLTALFSSLPDDRRESMKNHLLSYFAEK